MRRALLPVLGVLASLLAGCGQSNPDLIPQANADTLNATADRIQAACEKADRTEARSQVRLAEREIDALPRSVDPELRENLQAWIDRIQERIPRDCRAEESPTPSATATQAPTEAPTETATQAPTETATQAPTEAPTEEPTEAPTEAPTIPPEETEAAPDEDGGG